MLSDNGATMVVIFDINEEKGQAVATSLRKGLFCKVDVSDEDSVKAGFKKVMETCGRLDIMVNCAGILGPHGVKTEDVETGSMKVYSGASLQGTSWRWIDPLSHVPLLRVPCI